MDKPIGDGDYELTDGKAWLSAKGFSIRIHTTDEGIVVDIYKKETKTLLLLPVPMLLITNY